MEIGALKAKITHNFWGEIDTNSAKMGSKCTIYIRFSKIFSGRPRPLPYCEKIKKFPSLAFPQQLRWKFSHITYIEDRRFESKNYTQFWGEKSTRTRQKWAKNAPFASVFTNFLRETPTTPPPHYCKKIKKTLFGFIWSSTAKVKILPHHVYRRSEIWKQKLHTIFVKKIDTNSAKNGLRMHHLHPF